MNNNKVRKGFTLIEVVIVLAIAALIMVGVFFAVQGAQRAQRDNARKNLVNQVTSAAQAYAGNHSGDQPTHASGLGGYVTNLSVQGISMTLSSTDTPITCSVTSDHTTIWLTSVGVNKVGNICLESGDTYTGDSSVTVSTSVSTSVGP